MPHRSQTGTPRARGFAAMDANKQREIASMGGRAAHRSGNAHEFDAEEAREAGRRGGLARSASRRASRSIELADGQGVMLPEASAHPAMDAMPRAPGSTDRPAPDTGPLTH
jgi:general stress protein YciG